MALTLMERRSNSEKVLKSGKLSTLHYEQDSTSRAAQIRRENFKNLPSTIECRSHPQRQTLFQNVLCTWDRSANQEDSETKKKTEKHLT